MNELTEKKPRSAPPFRVSRKVYRWAISRAVNKLIENNPQLGAPEYRGRVTRHVRMSILLDRFLNVCDSDDFSMLNERGELAESFDLIRRFAETVTKLERHLYIAIPRTERQAKSLTELRAEADLADAEDEEPENET